MGLDQDAACTKLSFVALDSLTTKSSQPSYSIVIPNSKVVCCSQIVTLHVRINRQYGIELLCEYKPHSV